MTSRFRFVPALPLVVAGAFAAGCSSGGSGSPAPVGTQTPTPVPVVTALATPTSTPIAPVTPTASPTPVPTASPPFTMTGSPAPAEAALDTEMQSFMQTNGIRAGQLAVGHGGVVTFSHAYTNTSDATFAITQPSSIMRVSSNSKALVTAAITKLYAAGSVQTSTPVYAFLGITQPLLASQTPDARAASITVQELVDHTAGFYGTDGGAPEFNMYSIERAAGLSGPLTRLQFAQYLYGQPLQYAPGTQTLYSNEDYFLLARVVEKATGEDYFTWVNANVLAPVGISDAVVTATAASGRLSNEVLCDDPSTGYSVLTPLQAVVAPDCYGGISVYEVLDGPTSISISAQSLVKFLGTYNAYGLGAREAGYAREGSFVGSLSWMEARSDGNDFAFSFNSRLDTAGAEYDISPLTTFLESRI